ncbi:MAG: hypothetical protein WDN67_01165 [Candidatus Moraniibacteriota bacterium]
MPFVERSCRIIMVQLLLLERGIAGDIDDLSMLSGAPIAFEFSSAPTYTEMASYILPDIDL